MSECWLWSGQIDKSGYGRLGRKLAHRLIYEQHRGPIAAGYHLHHDETCPKNCVNPDHLTPMTPAEHSRLHPDNARKNWERLRARTHCSAGHELSGENLRLKPIGSRFIRICRICQREQHRIQQRAYRARIKGKKSFQAQSA